MTKSNTPQDARFDTGAELRRIRGGRSQQEFGELLGVSKNTILRYENNERLPDTEFLFKLNLIFGVDPTRVILGWETTVIRDPKEVELLTNYRAAQPEDRTAIERVCEMAAVAARIKAKGNT